MKKGGSDYRKVRHLQKEICDVDSSNSKIREQNIGSYPQSDGK